MRLKAVQEKISQRVLKKWLDENASEYLTEDENKNLKEKVSDKQQIIDFLNAQEDRTSYESVFC